MEGGTMMNAIKATWEGGKLVLAEPVDWPEGCEVVVEPLPAPASKIGLDESQWRDDPASRADWDEWIRTIEPFDFTREEEAEFNQFATQIRQYNVEAVRRQMNGNSET
jgi:hypothetical protein